MPQLITIGSRVQHAVRIPPVDEQGKAILINGTSHTELHRGAGVTRGVDAGLFQRWMDYAREHMPSLAASLFIIDDGQVAEPTPAPADPPEPAAEEPSPAIPAEPSSEKTVEG